MNASEVARALGVSTRTVQLWCERGKLRAMRPRGGYRAGGWLIRRSELRKALLSGRVKPGWR